MIALGFALALILSFKNASKFKIDTNIFSDLIIYGTISAIIFARLFYVIFEWDNYKDDIIRVFDLRSGGLAIYGAVIGASLSTFIYHLIKKVDVLKYADFVAPYFILAQAIGRFGNFFNQEAFGTNTNLPWGMTGNLIVEELNRLKAIGFNIDPSMNVHPTFLYEFLWNMIVFALLLHIRGKSDAKGRTLFAYLSFYGLGRMFIEGLRTDSLMLGAIRVNQLLAFVLFAFFAYMFLRTYGIRLKKSPAPAENDDSSPFSELAKRIKEERGSGEQDKTDNNS
jgi:phosphatidylglycerol:prolipoprotein diacylglycerol transferase